MKYVIKTVKKVVNKIKETFRAPEQTQEDTYVFEVRKDEVLYLIKIIKENFEGQYPEDEENLDPRSIFSMLKAAEKSILENENNAKSAR